MAQIIDGKTIAANVNKQTAIGVAELKELGITPKLAVILVGVDKPSQTYVRKKGESAKKIGIDFELHELPTNISKQEIVDEINKIQSDVNISGLIVQLPLPEPLYTTEVLNAIDPAVDVDCLTDVNLGKLVMKTNFMVPPTPGAVMTILNQLNVKYAGTNVTIVGAGALVGKPLSVMMLNEGASISVCNSRTLDTKEKCLSADIIVTGVGKKDLVTGDMVKPGAIVIDTGVCFEEGKMYGDVNFEEASQKASHITPTPGGVGPITVARLLKNTLICAQKKGGSKLKLDEQTS